MKVILSRKGFDSSNGGYPSPILPDGTMLSLPIPDDIGLSYSEIQYNGITYSEIIGQLTNNNFNEPICHLDPDIRPDLRITPAENWFPAFGQVHSAQGVLRNTNVEIGDVFLFFGWFRKTKESENGESEKEMCSNHPRFGDGNITRGISGSHTSTMCD